MVYFKKSDLIFSEKFSRSFGGILRLYGQSGGLKIFSSSIMVVGIGGVGSWAAEALARSGVGNITLIDFDNIAQSNVNRQIHANEGNFGKAKVLAMKERILLINPDCNVNIIEDFVEPNNWENIINNNKCDAVIDACDNFAAKITMSAWALNNNKDNFNKTLFITAGAAGGKELGHLVDIDDISNVTHDPIISKLRYELRKKYNAPKSINAAAKGAAKKIGIMAVYSKENVKGNNGNSSGGLNCSGYGSSVAVTASFGMSAAGWVLKKISQRG